MREIKLIKCTDSNYPQKLLEIENYPKELYVIGNEKLLEKDSIGIVGARDSTGYGEKCARNFAREISKENICVVSGMAVGIDTAAHEGAIREKGSTIAVLGCGFNNIYPKENTDLFNDILKKGGCAISEYSPNTKADLSKFPKRNRIISGLAKGILVVEAIYRSGSLITAKYAKKQNKKIFCIPSNIDEKTSVGTNRLIQNGAKLVIKAQDILDEIKNKVEEEIEEEYVEIYNCLTYMPTNINIIAKKCNLEISKLTQNLLMMELKGYAKSMPGNEYVRL